MYASLFYGANSVRYSSFLPAKPSPGPSSVTQKLVIRQTPVHMINRDGHRTGRSEMTTQTIIGKTSPAVVLIQANYN